MAFEHGDGSIVLDDAVAVICAAAISHDGLDFQLNEEPEDDGDVVHLGTSKPAKKTTDDVLATFNDEQLLLLHSMVAIALEEKAPTAPDGGTVKHSDNEKGESPMKKKHF